MPPTGQGTFGLNSLHDGALVSVFAQLPLEERHQALPLVCRRWQQLVHTPQLLHTITVDLSSKRALLRTQAFSAWLLRRAPGHVQRLTFGLSPPIPGDSHSGSDIDIVALGDASYVFQQDCRELSKGLMAAVSACAVAGSLTLLNLRLECLPHIRLNSALVGALRGLRALHLDVTESRMTVSTPLDVLTALEELRLSGDPLRLPTVLQLPTTLTRLELGNQDFDERIPGTLTALRLLRHMAFDHMDHASEQYNVLSQLTTLQQLHMAWCNSLPSLATLARLEGLKSLRLVHCPRQQSGEEASSTLQAILQRLTLLTELCVGFYARQLGCLPAALTGLSQLQHFSWEALPPVDPRLPAGPWLAGLRRLVLPADVAACSLQVLTVASQLQRLGLASLRGDRPAHLDVLRWAAQHPALRQLSFDPPAAADLETAAAVWKALPPKPSLSVVLLSYPAAISHVIDDDA